MDIQKLSHLVQKPPLFTKSTATMWDDEHISQGILKAHLNPNIDAASRKTETIDASVRWMLDYAQLPKGSAILDLGCGPGLYTQRFAEAGHNVTGIDFSKRSIEYAREQSLRNKQFICYHYQDYLTLNYQNIFNLIIMIYCDLGVLADLERDSLLLKIFHALKPGGLFIFDVFTPLKFHNAPQEENSWFVEQSGFWRPTPHLGLKSAFYYPESHTHLDQYIIMDEENTEIYRNWDHAYTVKTVSQALDKAHLNIRECFSDVTGKPWIDNSETLCVVAQKQKEP